METTRRNICAGAAMTLFKCCDGHIFGNYEEWTDYKKDKTT